MVKSKKQMLHILRLAELNKERWKIIGHNRLGCKHTEETKEKIGLALQGENNGMWKGDKASLSAIHIWIKARKPKPKCCEKCNKNKPFDLANISGEYKRDVKDFEWLCRSCHMNSDNRILNLKQYQNVK